MEKGQKKKEMRKGERRKPSSGDRTRKLQSNREKTLLK